MADEKYSKLVEPYIDHIAKWRATGASNKQIADKLGISLSSLKNYKKEYIELDNALSYGHSNISVDIAKTITDLALGYDYITEEVVKLKNGDGSESYKARAGEFRGCKIFPQKPNKELERQSARLQA